MFIRYFIEKSDEVFSKNARDGIFVESTRDKACRKIEKPCAIFETFRKVTDAVEIATKPDVFYSTEVCDVKNMINNIVDSYLLVAFCR